MKYFFGICGAILTFSGLSLLLSDKNYGGISDMWVFLLGIISLVLAIVIHKQEK